jgi:hypothetical protein
MPSSLAIAANYLNEQLREQVDRYSGGAVVARPSELHGIIERVGTGAPEGLPIKHCRKALKVLVAWLRKVSILVELHVLAER